MIRYRKDIDGLRALAVLPVLLYHAQIPGFSGGFVGVDVFFVISGYLITGILIKDMQAGTYSLAGFYERRIRRIMPALLTVLTFVLLVSPLSLLPSEFETLWKEVLGALFFVANIIFWSQSGYFSAAAETKPLLHTWSLGIEEQFYIVAPVALWITLRYARRYLTLVLAILLAISFAACVVLTPKYPGGSFYLLPTRAWELLAGSLLAALPAVAQGRLSWLREALAFSGLAMLCTAVFLYSKDISFPGYAAALPVLASVLMIRYGEASRLASILSWRPIVLIGLISYSLYLWHWPLVVYFRNEGWLENLAGRATVVLISVLLAYLTWRYIENYTRNRQLVGTPRLITMVGAGATLITAAASVYAQLGGWPQRVAPQVLAFDAGREDISPFRTACHIDGGLREVSKLCRLGGDHPAVLLWGDSHGVELARGIADAGVPVVQATYSSCPPEIGRVVRAHRPKCSLHNAKLLDYVSHSREIDAVVLVAYYNSLDQRLREMSELADHLRKSGKRVIVVGPTPTLPSLADLPTYLARGGTPTVRRARTADRFNYAFPGVDLVLPEEFFCKGEQCDLIIDGKPLLFDAHHPSMTAARISGAHVARCLQVQQCTQVRAYPTERMQQHDQ